MGYFRSVTRAHPPPDRVVPTRFLSPIAQSLITPPPLLAGRPKRIGASGLRLQQTLRSTPPKTPQPLHQPHEDPLPRRPRQQTVDQLPTDSHDLARHLDQRRTVRCELHPQQGVLLVPMPLSPAALLRQQQGTP